MEFGQISKEELPALSSYVAGQRLRVGTGEDDEDEGDDEDTGLEGTDGSGDARASGAGLGDSEGSDEVTVLKP